MNIITNYQLIDKLSETLNSLVYRAVLQSNNETIIVKILKENFPPPSAITRYKQEYHITSTLVADNIIKAYGLQRYQNTLAIFIEDFGGESLKSLMSKQQFSLGEVLFIAIQITEGLISIHTNNIIHKDINPSNIIYNIKTKQLKIIDFGISTYLDRENPTILNPNKLEGTLAYISPEQTGRMNRGIDYRSDFYSLGVTFYELLTHCLPFESGDPMELVHCHIAQQPTRPQEVIPSIPVMVSDIVMKLLAKTPEERYQSARGLKADLDICLKQLQSLGKISQFSIGHQDICDRFQIPEKLYGRDQEVSQLLSTFERVSQGSAEIVLVSGFSGIGKSALVHEVQKPIVRQRGYFISGKFDQLKRDIPYAAVTQAFQNLIQQLLAESKVELETWKTNILEALGSNGQVIIDLIPGVEQIIGKQSSVSKLGFLESQNRFDLLFSRFIRVFTQKNHPLVIFLDDLQWADLPSLKLIELLMTDPENGYLLIVGAYRSNEVDITHPLIQIREALKKVNNKISLIVLNSLTSDCVNELLSDTLKSSIKESKNLAKLLLQKTDGNPFFLTQLLYLIHKDNLLNFNKIKGCWQWDIKKIKSVKITENVVELMIKKIKRLNNNTQNIIKLAACIGNQFTLSILSSVNNKTEAITARELQPALQEGLIIPLNNNYMIPLAWEEEDIEDSSVNFSGLFINEYSETIPYKFLHDRVQQATYALIPQEKKGEIHLQVGRLILENTQANEIEENIFNIVNQFNEGIELISDQSERDRLAKLNLLAGQKAKKSTAYEPALKYLEIGLSLLNSNSWKNKYKLTIALYLENLEAYFLNAQYEKVEEQAIIILNQTKEILDRIQVYETKILCYNAKMELDRAIDTAFKALEELKLNKFNKIGEISIQKRLQNSLEFLQKTKQVENLIKLPLMTNRYKLKTIQILQQIMFSTMATNFSLHVDVILIQINLCIKYGNPPQAAAAYSYYGMLLCGVLKNIEFGYKFGKISIQLLENNRHIEKGEVSKLEPIVVLVYYGFIWCWKEWLRKEVALEKLMQGLHKGIESGNNNFACLVAITYCIIKLFGGYSLDIVKDDYTQHSKLIEKMKDQYSYFYIKICEKLATSLVQVNENNQIFYITGESKQQEEKQLENWTETNNEWLLFLAYFCKIVFLYFQKEYQEAIIYCVKDRQYIHSCSAYIIASQYNFYSSLSFLKDDNLVDDKNQLLEQIDRNQIDMKNWSEHCPENFQHKYDLVAAEKARVLGNYWEAAEFYEKAIQGAKKYEFIHEEAITYERAAEFYLSLNRQEIGNLYLRNAHHCYSRWGAKAKVKQLEKEYPQLLVKIDHQKSKTTFNPITTTGSDTSENLDLNTVIKASQALAGEIQLEKLLEKLMSVAIENAGAQKGILILQRDDNWVIEAQRTLNSQETSTLQSIPLESSNLLSPAIANYVIHSQETVILNDAVNEGQYIRDPYIIANQPKSILCTPLINQGKLSGILYLENNLTTNAFTSQRVELLRTLSAQAAISIENSRLYQELAEYNRTLEDKVAERTLELQEKNEELSATLHKLKTTQNQIIAQEKLASLGALTAGIAHEIKNPLNFVNNFAQLSVDLTQELQDEINNQQEKLDTETVEYIEEILTDLRENVERINHHGKRADNIVHGMMMHAQGSSGKREPTKLNNLLAEFVNLAYYGMRANDEEFNIIIESNYDESVGEINLVPQDISRVFLNLTNNACYAAYKKQKQLLSQQSEAISANESSAMTNNEVEAGDESKKFEPMLWVSTKNLGDKVEIRIRDNGEGMPPDVVEKIFNPFFTTKPTGEGTGLGLSISHDIIVQGHQGEIKVETEVGSFAEFIVILPR